ncbi:MAG TPA: ABC transporter ATP-binding protein [Candidatus Polarisedimenticolaceae bacterium]|nr:ABC transporter ATP-binding protein [Candidatus Polarisedimenticolaceae bacterium]
MNPLKGFKSQTLQEVYRALHYFRDDLGLILFLLSLTACSTALGLLQAWPVAVLVDSALGTPSTDNWMHRLFLAPLPEDPIKRIIGLGIMALLLRFAHELIAMARRLLAPRIHYNGLLRVRGDLYRKLQGMHLDYHRSRPMSDSLFRLTTDTLGFQAVLTVMINLLVAGITLLVIVGLLMGRNGALTLIALSIAPPLMWVNVIFGRRLGEKTRKSRESDSAFTSSVQRSMSAIVLTQAFGREEDEYHRFGASARRCVRAWFGIHRQEVAYGLSVGVILAVGASLILTYGGMLLHGRQLTPGELMIFMTYLGMIYDPLCQITGFRFNLESGLAGARRVFEVFDRDAVVIDSADATPLPLQPRSLILEAVGFEYSSEQKILQQIDVKIEPGQSVAFVGSSGAGKSTLLNLLLRFYDPTVGTVKLDQYDLRQIKLKDLRRHVALVLQDSVILPTSIAENIAYGCPAATYDQIREAARLAGAENFIEALPHQYQTALLDSGMNLSGGQRQRIALARALLTKAPILVLDEPTSALDSEHEQLVIDTLTSLKAKHTVVLVSHHIGAVMSCDRIYVLDQGMIVEHGSHQDLLRRGGIYAAMAKQQLRPDFPVFPEAA